MKQLIQREVKKLADLLSHIQDNAALSQAVADIATVCLQALQQGKKILFAGNGGSAADSQHLAAELVSRLRFNRPGLAAIALTTDTSALTAIGNDYGYDMVFSRQIESIGQAGDVFIAISTSGKSPNILKALDVARAKGITCIGFSGQSSPLMQAHCEYVLNIPSSETPKIQECHILFGHIICALIEDTLFGAEYDPLLVSLKENVA